MKRAILIILDGCGAGEAPDAPQFNDHDHPSTIKHVWEVAGPLALPNLDACGFLKACRITSGEHGLREGWGAKFGRLREMSQGKDSVTGHWELMGVVTDTPFPTYPTGFPADLVSQFEDRIGSKILGNKAASGTQILSELGALHLETGNPIVYTSADSVFQIACHEERIPLDRLYEICQIARDLCKGENNVQRVIARPFLGTADTTFWRTEHRKDYPLPAPPCLIDVVGEIYGVGVVPELFGGRGFRVTKRTQNNAEHEIALWSAMESDARFIFANFEDFDMLYGHRNDPIGFGSALERFDVTLGKLLNKLNDDDLLILTADHGNDPTTPSTDHSREFVPVCVIGKGIKPSDLGDIDGMTAVSATVAKFLNVNWTVGQPLLDQA